MGVKKRYAAHFQHGQGQVSGCLGLAVDLNSLVEEALGQMEVLRNSIAQFVHESKIEHSVRRVT